MDSGESDAAEGCECGTGKSVEKAGGKDGRAGSCGHPRNYSWAELLKRVFEVDVLECPECGGRMRILCAINPPDAIRKILDCLGLPSRPPPFFPALQESYFDQEPSGHPANIPAQLFEYFRQILSES